ncbi:MAG: hypothetical protein GF311_13520 [Candidatus Lokiarchaeota archaeon]|nr:hypothetical protein [Candidatus Lokiarchaeota archaeon]
MRDIDGIIRELSKGYTPQREGSKPRIMKIYDKTFKPLVNRKDLDTFFKLYEYEDPTIQAWAFLGIYQILENKTYLYGEDKERLDDTIMSVLHNTRKFSYVSGDIETTTSIRTHHARRISWLHPDIVFEPVYEYVQEKAPEIDEVISELLVDLLSKKDDPRVEPLLLEFAENIPPFEIESKLKIIRAFENYGQQKGLDSKDKITAVFKRFLDMIWEKRQESGENSITDGEEKLEQRLIRVGANLELDLEFETLRFLKNVNKPFDTLDQVAEHYKENEQFRTLLMEKLEKAKTQRIIKDLLKAIAIIQSEIPDCQQLIIDKIKAYEFNDTELIINMMESGLLNENIILQMLKEGEEWELVFVRELLNLYPKKLESWDTIREEIISILTEFPDHPLNKESDSELYTLKKFALQVTIDLKHPKLVHYCLENFLRFEDEDLRKMALFALITFGTDDILTELRKVMSKNEETRKYVKTFWDQLERRDWKFYY